MSFIFEGMGESKRGLGVVAVCERCFEGMGVVEKGVARDGTR